MIHQFSGFRAPITQLFELANTPFFPQPFRRACESFTTFNASSSHDDLWYFSINGGPNLIVSIETEVIARKKSNNQPEYRQLAVSSAITSICWWETYLKTEHEKLANWEAERAEFDRLFAESLAVSISVLGSPQLQGMNADRDQHRYAIWRGKTGLLILQQSAYDPQFGFDVNYWVQPWSGLDPIPTSPFIDWLFCLSSQ